MPSFELVTILTFIPLMRSTQNFYNLTAAKVLRLVGKQESRALLCRAANVAFVT